MKCYGFNLPWMLYVGGGKPPVPVDERALDFIAAEGFNFARFPMHYHAWAQPGCSAPPDEATATIIDGYVHGCRARGIHAVLNLHHAPGYSVSATFRAAERRSLWTDPEAQEVFLTCWEFFARRYQHLDADAVIFNPVNEPPVPGVGGFTYAAHESLMRRTAERVWAVDPDRAFLIDGVHYGTAPSTGLADLRATQGVRGYQPFAVSHHGAEWDPAFKTLPPPQWPGLHAEGRVWDKGTLYEIYEPWRALEAQGVNIHVTEFGCYNRTPNDLALRWLTDLMSIFREYGWGWALWELEGTFGIINHGRPGARYENLRGYQVDRGLLELIRPPSS